MKNPLSPGVYVREISTLPPSVAEVSTAVPAFIGYTETRPDKDNDGVQIARINSLLEYEELFGTAQASTFAVEAHNDSTSKTWSIEKVTREVNDQFLMYYALSLYFNNGGGSCYIVSIGDYEASPSPGDFEKGLTDLEKEDEPTLILAPDALELAPADYYTVCEKILDQCEKLKDRFAIFDLPDGENQETAFRNGISKPKEFLMYGAAYTPHLKTSLSYFYKELEVNVDTKGKLTIAEDTHNWQKSLEGDNSLLISYTGNEGDEPKVRITTGAAGGDTIFQVDTNNNTLRISIPVGTTGEAIATAWGAWASNAANNASGYKVTIKGDGSSPVAATADTPLEAVDSDKDTATMDSLKDSDTALYNLLKTHLTSQRVTLPPSPAIAGVYARVDRSRGVWKAPANESLSSVIEPVHKITNDEQDRLNIDDLAGKSINAIRAFTGKGTLVWGARTLAGNDNEWKYISVRRLFNMIEESCQKSTAFAVFEPNDATTWLKVKAMIESFLFSLWERGALAGPTPEAAYFVHVGLGKTMTTDDILNGRMKVKIGVAAVRPAEFIILEFSHKLQEA